MANAHEIKSEKILVKGIFSKMWFRIPEYQRPYIWGKDEVNDLLDDLTFALTDKPEQEYFLGSFVFQTKKANSAIGQSYDEHDLLDGQQRMTTLMMLFACIRDLSDLEEVQTSCQNSIYQKGDNIDDIPERTRIVFAIRQEVQDFVDEFVKRKQGTSNETELAAEAESSSDPSVPNMAKAMIEMRSYLQNPEKTVPLERFVKFLRTKVLLIYVATETLDDAFRLFTILNNRGKPLRSSDILKSTNLGKLEKEADKIRYAKLWEEAEGELGDDFDRFLNHVRTVLVKDKARLNLLQEFEDKIYEPKEREKSTGQPRLPLLKKGKETFQLVERYLKHHSQLLNDTNYDETGKSFQFDNLVKVMLTGLPSTDWIPPLLLYFNKFKYDSLLAFLTKLDNKFSADWISQYSPTDRLDRMSQVMRVIEAADTPAAVLADSCFEPNAVAFLRSVETVVYGRRFTRYLLLKLDYLYQDHSSRLSVESLSVEHILPQNPSEGSQWRVDFTDDQRRQWVDRLGNLVLISTKKNTSQGNSDYEQKKTKYFAKKISTCPNSLRVLRNMNWRPADLEANHHEVISQIRNHYGILASVTS